MMLLSILAAGGEVLILAAVGEIIENLTNSNPETFWQSQGLYLFLLGVLVLLVMPIIELLVHLLLGQTLVPNLQTQTSWRAHRQILKQPMYFFQNDFAGRLANRVMNQGQAMEDSVYLMIEALWFASIYFVISLGMAIFLNPLLALPLMIWFTLWASATYKIVTAMGRAGEKTADGRSRTMARVVDAYSNVETVKLFGGKDQEEKHAQNAFVFARLRMIRFMRLITTMRVTHSVLSGLVLMGTILTGVFLWQKSYVEVGAVVAIIGIALRLNGMSGWIMWILLRVYERMGTLREGLRSIAVQPGIQDANNAQDLVVEKAVLEFQNIHHHYGKTSGGLDSLNITIQSGEKVGIVGPSGAGKSTLIKLLLRYHDPEQGQILIDGQNIKDVTQHSLRGAIGVVTQDSALLHRSVQDNLLYGRPDANMDALLLAAQKAEAHDFISGLDDGKGGRGYHSVVGERGVKLSGGQRQRLSIARVLLKDAPIMILDEATSALDSQVEKDIQKSLEKVMKGKTVLAVAHRLSTISQMDRIIVMDKGCIVEEGTHGALIAQNGLYASLWAHQTGGMLGED
jgi:ATP-binding cassette subfamily B multidrug efflux pump